MQVIPLIPIDAQSLTVIFLGQQYHIRLRQREQVGLFIDVMCNREWLINSALCLNRSPCAHLSPVGGDLFFIDMKGFEDPSWEGLGNRFILCWQNEGENIVL